MLRGLIRIVLFWAILAGVVAAIAANVHWLDIGLIGRVAVSAFSGDISGVSTPAFAYALAWGLGAAALGFVTAFFVMHVTAIRFTLWWAGRHVRRAKTALGFAADYERIHKRLERHWLIGHAWSEFDKTLIEPREPGELIRNTIRPQGFVNVGVAREALFGLKMMGSIPSYFVGIGLLLTFFGLVLALGNAAAAVNSTDAQGMQSATRELLQVATFKFSTSIAGLGASIVLSFFFRTFTIFIESAFDSFCADVEKRLRYAPPQAITAEMNQRLAEQLTELKQINSADFFSRMGEQLSPSIQAAFSSAFAPVAGSIDQAVSRLADTSQTGVEQLIQQFTQGVQTGAGTELRELAATLEGVRATLADAQRNISGSGEDFGRRMAEAADNLNRMIAEAGDKLGESSEWNRAALSDVVAALRETFDRANAMVEEALAATLHSTTNRMETAISSVFAKLETQVGGFQESLAAFQAGLGESLGQSTKALADSRSAAVETISQAAAASAKALEDGLARALQEINAQFAAFGKSLQGVASTMDAQASAITKASEDTRSLGDAFSKTAQDVRTAAQPLALTGEKIAGATERLDATMKTSVEALQESQGAGRQLAEALTGHVGRMSETWVKYSEHFAKVDQDLAAAFRQVHEASEKQQQILADYAIKVDAGFAQAVEKLNPLLAGLSEGAGELADSVERLGRVTGRPVPAE